METTWEPKRMCCCSLRKGAIIQAYIRIAISAVYIILTVDVLRRILRRSIFAEVVIMSSIIASGCFSMIFSIMLIHGVQKIKPTLLVPYMIMQEFEVAVLVFLALLFLIFLGVMKHVQLFFVFLFLAVGVICLLVYLILSIRSCIKELKCSRPGVYVQFRKEEETPPPPEV